MYPKCQAASRQYRRVIKNAPRGRGPKSKARAAIAQKETNNQNFVSSGDKDAMLHKSSKRQNADQVAEAHEIVKKGTYEGF